MAVRTGVKEIRLDKKLVTSADPSLIGENYQSLKNLRYISGGKQSVGGMSKINSTALSAYPKVRSAYQFDKDQPSEKHLLVQAYNSDLTSSRVLQHTGDVPETGDFSSTEVWTDSPGAGRGRFSKASNGYVAYCNGVDTCIWGGDETPVGAFINYDPNGVWEYDVTELVNNTLTSSSFRVTNSSGGNDSYTALLLSLNNNVTDSSINAHTVTNTNVTFSNTYKKFGTHSGYFNGTSAHLSLSDDAHFDFSGGSFCIDGWFRVSSLSAIRPIFYQQTDANNYIKFYVDTTGAVVLSVHASSSEVVSVSTPEGTITTGTWYHIELDENGDDWIIFVNGVNKAQVSDNSRCANYTGDIYLGYDGSARFYGYIDELRVSTTYRHTTDFSKPTVAYSTSDASGYFYIGSLQPIKGFNLYFNTVNTAVSAMTVYYWSGSDWVEVSNLSDGTSSGGISCSKTGSVTFDSTAATAEIKEYNGYILYFYKVYVSVIDNTTDIYHVALDAPMQQIKDMWDGVEREALSCLVWTGSKYKDYTIRTREQDYASVLLYNDGDASYQADPYTYANFSGLSTSQYFVVGFSARTMGVSFRMVSPQHYNTTASTVCTVSYWNGASWTSVGEINDSTSENGISLHTSGLISWTPPDKSLEFKTVLPPTPTPMYYYKFSFSKSLSSKVCVDYITGIPAPNTITGYKFPLYSQNRLMLCNNQDGAKNSVLVSAANAPNVYNGEDATELYIGDDREITGGVGLFSQFGGNLYDLTLFFKDTEMWAMSGRNPETWEIFNVSQTIGCPAPHTICQVNSPTELSVGGNRNLVIWQGADGIYLSDGRAPIPIHSDISNYFDKNNSECINAAMIGDSVGFFDNEKMEYHWLFASGKSATYLNKELVFSWKYMSWFEIDRGEGKYLQYGVGIRDIYGNSYTYGFIDTGYMERLEYGTDFDGNDIVSELWTGEIAPDNGSIWVDTRIRHFNLFMKSKTTTTNNVTVTHYGDSKTSGTSFTMSPISPGKRLAMRTQSHGLGDHVFHSFKLNMITDDETIGFEPIYMAMDYQVVREMN